MDDSHEAKYYELTRTLNHYSILVGQTTQDFLGELASKPHLESVGLHWQPTVRLTGRPTEEFSDLNFGHSSLVLTPFGHYFYPKG
jgi:hypothetical protein